MYRAVTFPLFCFVTVILEMQYLSLRGILSCLSVFFWKTIFFGSSITTARVQLSTLNFCKYMYTVNCRWMVTLIFAAYTSFTLCVTYKCFSFFFFFHYRKESQSGNSSVSVTACNVLLMLHLLFTLKQLIVPTLTLISAKRLRCMIT